MTGTGACYGLNSHPTLGQDAMNHQDIKTFLDDLKSTQEATRTRATQSLWQCWFRQKGIQGLQQLEESQGLLIAGKHQQAEAMLTEIITAQPDFVEAWNRRAVLYYVIGDYQKSLLDCDRVIELMPVHFGALHGKGLSHMALGNYIAAIQAFRQALAVQPYALINQKLILECTAKLS
ncbi:MAG TPA: tetratricopeptide repeat protein [Candidatus Obscuribacterales bacterium]